MPKKKYYKKKKKFTVKKNAKAIQKLKADIEYKRKDDIVSAQSVDTSGYMYNFSITNLGDDADMREGSEIRNKKLIIRGYIDNNNGTPQDCIVRLCLCRWLDPNGAGGSGPIVWSTVYQCEQFDSAAVDYGVNALRNTENYHRVDVKYDETLSMDTSLKSIIPFKITSKIAAKTTYLKNPANGSTANDILTNSYHLLVLSNVVTTANAPTIVFNSRLTYTDA